MTKYNTRHISKVLVTIIAVLIHLFWYVSFSKAANEVKLDECARKLGFKRSISLYKTLIEVANTTDLDPIDLLTIAILESSINPEVISFNKNRTYDIGLLGVNSKSAEHYCKDLNVFNEYDSILCGAKILKRRQKTQGFMWQGSYHSFTMSNKINYYNKFMRLRNACR